MSSEPLDPLPLEPEEKREKIPQSPLAEDAYASDIRQELREQATEPPPPGGVARLFSGIKSLFGGRRRALRVEEAPDGELPPASPNSAPPGEERLAAEDEPAGEWAPEGEEESSGDMSLLFPGESGAGDEVEVFLEEGEGEVEIPSYWDLSVPGDRSEEEPQAPSDRRVTPFWEVYRVGSLEEEQEGREPPKTDESTPAPASGEDEKEWRAFLSSLLKRQEDRPSPLDMDENVMADRLKRSGMYPPDSDSMPPRPRTGRVEEASETPEKGTAPFLWEEEADLEEAPSAAPPAAEAESQAPDRWGPGAGEEEAPAAPAEAGLFDLPEENVQPEVPVERLSFTDDAVEWEEESALPGGAAETPFLAEQPPAAAEKAGELLEEPAERPLSEAQAGDLQRLRPIVLEDYEPPPAPEAVEPSALQEAGQALSRLWKSQSVLTRVAAALLLVLVLALGAAIPLYKGMLNRSTAAAPTAPPTPARDSSLPYPIGLRLTGGWFFNLQPSRVEEGVWKPEAPEWLEGSEIRRVVAIPWSRQSEAVIQSLAPGDALQLQMSNNDVQNYTVESVERVARTDVYMLSDREASLVLILYQEDSNERWVVVGKP